MAEEDKKIYLPWHELKVEEKVFAEKLGLQPRLHVNLGLEFTLPVWSRSPKAENECKKKIQTQYQTIKYAQLQSTISKAQEPREPQAIEQSDRLRRKCAKSN